MGPERSNIAPAELSTAPTLINTLVPFASLHTSVKYPFVDSIALAEQSDLS